MHASKVISPATNSNTHAGYIPVQQPESSEAENMQQCLAIQTKLTVGAPDDPLEHEADAMADTVMRMPAYVSGNTTIQRKCAHCEEEKAMRKPLSSSITPFIQTKSNGEGTTSNTLTSQINNSRGNGTNMDGDTRSFMETRFGSDFSNVKIHTGNESVQMNRELSAKAFTVGNDIYFNEGQYNPGSNSGKHLLAHELTHTIQQGTAPKIQKRNLPHNSPMHDPIHDPILDQFSEETGTPREMANAYSPDYEAWLTLNRLERLALPDLLDQTALLSLPEINQALRYIYLSDFSTRRLISIALRVAQLNRAPLSVDPTASTVLVTEINLLPAPQAAQVNRYINTHQSRASMGPDLFSGTSTVAVPQHNNIETVLNPGATVSAAGVVTTAAPSPGCADGTFETQMRAAVIPRIHSRAAAFNALHAHPPALPMPSFGPIADVAQQEVDNHFRPYLNATTLGASGFALGSATASSLIRDQSATTQWQTPNGRKSWVQYWMNTDGEAVNNTHHCTGAVFDNLKTAIATDASLLADIDATVNGWPAEATGGIHLQPYVPASQIRRKRWDAFTTIIHEYIHILRHPNYAAAQRQVGTSGLQILKEGVDDLLRRDVWDATAGNLSGRVAQPAYAPNRVIIEGGSFTFDATQVDYHGDYPQIAQARSIEHEVGINNIKAAYFLGHVELLGLGQGTIVHPAVGANPAGDLTNIGMWQTTDADENEMVNTLPAETLAQVQNRFNATAIQTAAGAVIAADPLPAQVKIPGIRTVVVLSGQSLAHIANINGITVFELVRANNLSSGANPAVGTRLKIPRH